MARDWELIDFCRFSNAERLKKRRKKIGKKFYRLWTENDIRISQEEGAKPEARDVANRSAAE
jgi:hypothetical protein